jgi:tetratricopeptide (TPR) repeat protein
VELVPSSGPVLAQLADAQYMAKDYRAAFQSLSAALRLIPSSRLVQNLVPRLARGLVYVGWEAHKQGRENEAIDALDEAAELKLTSDVEARRDAVLTSGFHGTDAELAALDQAARSAPHDFSPHVRLDYALSTRAAWPSILAMWATYLADNPDDARAYRERAGTFNRFGRRIEALADAERACELGSSVGCALMRRL